MNIVLCSMIDEFFMPGFQVFIKSLLEKNPWFDLPIRLIDVGLSQKSKEECVKQYSNIHFVKPKKENYKRVSFEKTAQCLWNTYYKLDIFSYDDVDRLVFIDLDILVCDDIRELFEVDKPLSGCNGYALGSDAIRKDINTGVMVINKPFLNDGIYKQIIDYTAKAGGFSMPDQKSINQFFKKKINRLPKYWNCEKRLFKGKNYKISIHKKTRQPLYHEGDTVYSCKLLHYVSVKPWQKQKDEINLGYRAVEDLWLKYYEGEMF